MLQHVFANHQLGAGQRVGNDVCAQETALGSGETKIQLADDIRHNIDARVLRAAEVDMTAEREVPAAQIENGTHPKAAHRLADELDVARKIRQIRAWS